MWACRPGNIKSPFDCDLAMREKEAEIYHKNNARLPNCLAVTHAAVESAQENRTSNLVILKLLRSNILI